MDPIVGAACIAAIPATIAAVASIRANRRVRTRNGETIGELLESHSAQDQENFELLHKGQRALWEAIGRVEGHQRGDAVQHDD